MTVPAGEVVQPATSFDAYQWPPTKARIVAAGLTLAFAAALWAQGGVGRVLGTLLLLDTLVQILPWRYPRSARRGSSVWLEASLYLAAPVTFAVVMVITGHAPWLTRWPAAGWVLAAVGVGGALLWLGGANLRLLLLGGVKFVAAPVTGPHKWARATTVVVAPPCEEMVFRGVVLSTAGVAALPVGLLGAIAFVARHHLPTGRSPRTSDREFLTQALAAVALLWLRYTSGSIIPALIAHVLNNIPSTLLEFQRPTLRNGQS